ncbi:MAG: M50 family metallopeptidase, partial [Bacteroidota bacterium]
FGKIPMNLVLNEVKSVEIIRDGKTENVILPEESLNKLINHRSPIFSVRMPFIAQKFAKESVAKDSGMELGDVIVGINGNDIIYFMDFRNEIQNHKNESVVISVVRDMDTINLQMQLDEEGLIGVYPSGNLDDFFNLSTQKYTFVEAIPAGFNRTISGIDNYLKQLKLLFSPKVKAYEGVGGFITIGSIFPEQWHWESFWKLTAFLSIMLAIINILPIPALDGGHVLFLFYEIIARRKPSDKFLEYAQVVGMVILFSLMIFANGNDIYKLFK